MNSQEETTTANQQQSSQQQWKSQALVLVTSSNPTTRLTGHTNYARALQTFEPKQTITNNKQWMTKQKRKQELMNKQRTHKQK